MVLNTDKLDPGELGGSVAGAAPRVRARQRDLLLLVATAALALLGYRNLIGFDPASLPSYELRGLEGMLFEPSGSSPILIFSATAWLLARRWTRLRASLGGPAHPLAAALLLAIAFALGAWSYYVREVVLLVPSLSAALLGGALAVGGWPAARAILLPALFLLLAVPIPPALLNRFLFDLQVATANSTAAILNAVGIEAFAQSERIYSGGKIFQVIESCSGVRTIETLFMSSFLFHDLFYRSRLQSALLVASSLAIGLVVNQVRVLTIVLNPYSHFAAVHTAQGLVMIVAGVLLLAAVDSLLTRVLPARPWWRRSREADAPLAPARLAAVVAWAALFALATVAIRPWQPPAVQVELSSVPVELGGWKASGLKLDREYLGSVGFSEWVHRRYARDAEAVDVLLGTNRRLDERIDFVSSKVGVLGSGTQTLDRGEATLPNGRRVERLELRTAERDVLLAYVWTEGVAADSTEVLRSALALDRGPWRRPGRALVVRLATEVGDSPEQAEARLREIASLLDAPVARVLADPS